MDADLHRAVASSADAADLHASAPTVLLELQTLLGSLAASVTERTDRGRRPFRPGPEWAARLGSLAYGVYLLADQTSVDVNEVVLATAENLHRQSRAAQAADEADWPFRAG